MHSGLHFAAGWTAEGGPRSFQEGYGPGRSVSKVPRRPAT